MRAPGRVFKHKIGTEAARKRPRHGGTRLRATVQMNRNGADGGSRGAAMTNFVTDQREYGPNFRE